MGQCEDLFATFEALLCNRRVRMLLVQPSDLQGCAGGLPMARVDVFWLCSGLGLAHGDTALQRLPQTAPAARQLLLNADDPACQAEDAIPTLVQGLLGLLGKGATHTPA